MIKPDNWIHKMVAQQGMITPFEPRLVRVVDADSGRPTLFDSPRPIGQTRPVISYGLSSYGYDIRLSPVEFQVFQHVPGTVIDPKRFASKNLQSVQLHHDEYGDYFILPAHSYGLGVAIERLEVPENITVLCIGKSTYARAGIIANLTPAEAGWRGHLTLEFSNSSSADCRIYANEGVVQLLFFEGEPCNVCYETRRGKYQDQEERVTLPKV